MSSFPDERHLDATAEGVAAAVAMLCPASCPAPAEVASEATRPHRQALPAPALLHRWFPVRRLVGCGLTEAMAPLALREDPGAVTCRDCLLRGPYQQLHQAVAALERLGVAVGDPATAQARGLVGIIYSGMFGDGRPRLAWRIDPSAAELPSAPIQGDVRLVAEAQAALAGRPFTRMETRHLVEKMALAKGLVLEEEPAVPREEEAEEVEALPAVPAPPPVHYSDWGRCLEEREDDVLSEDPKKVTCAECLRLMAEDAAEEAPRSALTPEQQQSGRDAVLTPEQEQQLRDKMQELLAEDADLTAAEIGEQAANALRFHLDDNEATIPERVFELAHLVKEAQEPTWGQLDFVGLRRERRRW